jgi:hypothetical protein
MRQEGKDAMLTAIENLMGKLPPPARQRNENIACLIGFLFGAIGLAIYLRTVVDFIFPLGIAIAVLAVYPSPPTIFAGAIVVALYGYFRVKTANEQRTGSPTAGIAPRV